MTRWWKWAVSCLLHPATMNQGGNQVNVYRFHSDTTLSPDQLPRPALHRSVAVQVLCNSTFDTETIGAKTGPLKFTQLDEFNLKWMGRHLHFGRKRLLAAHQKRTLIAIITYSSVVLVNKRPVASFIIGAECKTLVGCTTWSRSIDTRVTGRCNS